MLLAGCGGHSSSPPVATPSAKASAAATRAPALPPALCRSAKVHDVGRVTAPAATELSGLVLSPSGMFWTHNDSGDSPRIFGLGKTGELKRTVTVNGATAVDWEDIAMRGRTIYVGDIGDNTAQRADVTVYSFPEPTTDSVTATTRTLHYADHPHDAEALLVDPRNGTIVVVTKDYAGAAGVYVARGNVLHKAGKIDLGPLQPVTAGDVSADGRTIALRTYTDAYVWRRTTGSIANALKRKPCHVPADLSREGQGEALALTRNGRAFYTVPEGATPRLRRYGG